MATVPYDHTITEMLQTVAELICLKPKEERVQWIVFFLKEIESMQSKAVNSTFFQALQENIANRQEAGQW